MLDLVQDIEERVEARLRPDEAPTAQIFQPLYGLLPRSREVIVRHVISIETAKPAVLLIRPPAQILLCFPLERFLLRLRLLR